LRLSKAGRPPVSWSRCPCFAGHLLRGRGRGKSGVACALWGLPERNPESLCGLGRENALCGGLALVDGLVVFSARLGMVRSMEFSL